MRPKTRSANQLPEINLVPMMDVLMTVLTFFILVSMTLTGAQMPNVQLPKAKTSAAATVPKDPLLVGLDQKKQILLNDKPVTPAELDQAVADYFAKQPDGMVVLKADRTLPFRSIEEVLTLLKAVGGDRVGLSFEQG
ncbi:ExbD/TolR family protein [Limnothrix redekei]|uniref:Biopolymer transporter ExbD n=1 Tax=Limnothrix redekei LRLZ20PSL1 TaxID=3112953 RepID=A0ABW7C7Q6_9CYAN